jgi:ornithine carbamoyltransferase
MVGSALVGIDFRIAAPDRYQPDKKLQTICLEIAKLSGASINITNNVKIAVRDCDFLYTDVWVSMGEPPEVWSERINLLNAYQVNKEVMKLTNNPNAKFLHCLPAFHNRDTIIGEEIYQKFGLSSMEVTEDLFESNASVVFDQAENRLHTIKAIMVATLNNTEELL